MYYIPLRRILHWKKVFYSLCFEGGESNVGVSEEQQLETETTKKWWSWMKELPSSLSRFQKKKFLSLSKSSVTGCVSHCDLSSIWGNLVQTKLKPTWMCFQNISHNIISFCNLTVLLQPNYNQLTGSDDSKRKICKCLSENIVLEAQSIEC